jgi:hypothetical protein
MWPLRSHSSGDLSRFVPEFVSEVGTEDINLLQSSSLLKVTATEVRWELGVGCLAG